MPSEDVLPLMSSRLRRSLDAMPWGFIGMIGLIAVIECWVSWKWLDFTDPVSLSWRYSASAVRQVSRPGTVLCMGDSLIKHGLIPRVIEEASGRSAVNISAARAPGMLTYFLLRRALDAGAAPEAIVIDAKAAVLLADPEFNLRYWQEILTPRELVTLSRWASTRPFTVAALVGRVVPSVRARLEIRSSVMAAVAGRSNPVPAMNRVLLRNWEVNDGANLSPTGLRAGETEGGIERRLRPDFFHVDRSNAAGLNALMGLAESRRIPVFWLLPPIAPSLQARRDRSGAEAGYEEFIRTFVTRYPRTLTILDARWRQFSTSNFVDETHLNKNGAAALSLAVAAALEATLDTERAARRPCWIALASPSDPPSVAWPLVEDLEQSTRILDLRRSDLAASR